MAEPFSLTEEKIENILAEKKVNDNARVTSMFANMPGYGTGSPAIGSPRINMEASKI